MGGIEGVEGLCFDLNLLGLEMDTGVGLVGLEISFSLSFGLAFVFMFHLSIRRLLRSRLRSQSQLRMYMSRNSRSHRYG